MSALDFDAYLRRIGLHGHVSLAQLHRAHVIAIPFENLDPHCGVPISLQPAALEHKLVAERRGGYCFEQNLLLAAALRCLGAEVDLLLGRVRLGRPPGTPRPRTHLVLRVRAQGAVWLADAGFGPGTLLQPIPFGPGVVHEQSGWRFRLVADGPEHVLEAESESGWEELYGFVPEPVPMVDIETSNWFTCTHPRSPFVTGLRVCTHRPDGSYVALGDWPEPTLTERAPGHTLHSRVGAAQVPELLASQFGLPGFVLTAGGRLTRAGPGGPDHACAQPGGPDDASE